MNSVITKQALSTIASLIKAGRQQRKLSQADLASRIGTSRQTIAAIEKGSPTVAIATVLEAAHIVGIPLLSGDKQQLNHWQNILSGFDAIVPKRVDKPKIADDDDF